MLSPPAGGGAGLSNDIIQSVSFGQLFGEMAVVGSHLALSGQRRQGQLTMVSIEVGSRLGKSL